MKSLFETYVDILCDTDEDPDMNDFMDEYTDETMRERENHGSLDTTPYDEVWDEDW